MPSSTAKGDWIFCAKKPGVAAAGRDDEALPALALHGHAEARQQLERDLDVAPEPETATVGTAGVA